MDNKLLIKHFYEDIISNNRIEEIEKYVSPNCSVRIGENSIVVGMEGMKQHVIDVRKTYPDLTIRVIRQYTDKEYVISEIITEGTHLGEWLGIKPSGKKLVITGVNIDRLENGKIVEHGGAANTFDTFWAEGIIQASSVD
jgi:predicted ester cyclase